MQKVKTEFSLMNRNISYEELLDNDVKILAFEYLIPRPLFPPVQRVSKFYCFRKGENPFSTGLKYSIFNLIFGWLGFPFGPIYAINAIKKNMFGIDVSVDCKSNITKEDFNSGIVNITKIEKIFFDIDRGSKKEIKKAFINFQKNENHKITQELVTGIRYNENEEVYVLGLSEQDLEVQNVIETYLYKRFYKHTKFEFINIESGEDIANKLKVQGTVINLY